MRRRSDLSDYTGRASGGRDLRITDKDNGGVNPAATVADMPYSATLPCQPTSHHDRQPVLPLDDVRRAHARLGQGRKAHDLGARPGQVYDGGADGVAATAPNTVFLRQGVFAP